MIQSICPTLASRRGNPVRRAAKVRGNSACVEAVEPRLLFATFVVDSAADSGAGTLRQAILNANANDTPGPVDDEIVFNILPAGTHTIALASPLPVIQGNVTIDGSTQPGYEPDHTPVVQLDGRGAGAGAVGLRIASTGPMAASNVIGLVISGFSGNGVEISGDWNAVAQCYIGTDFTGASAGPGNGGHGVLVTGDNNLLAENVVAFSGGDGVAVAAGAIGNTLAPNSFFSNAGLAIDLGDDGPTPNDAADTDNGANRLQNYPVITSVAPAASGNGLTVIGSINTTPDTLIEVVLYSSPTNDGEGRNVLEVLHPIQTDGSGTATFSATVSTATATDWITATATSYAFSAETAETNTSEFSAPVSAAAAPPLEVYVRGSTWAGADADPSTVTFKEYLQATNLGDATYGFRVDNLAPNTTLPWINTNEVVLRYAAPVSGPNVPTAASVSLDGQLSDYAVTTVTPLDARTYVLALDRPLGVQPAGVADPVQGDRVRLTVAGVEGTFVLNPLQGDADRAATKRVTALDLGFVKARANRTSSETPPAGGAGYTPFADVNGDGRINATDLGAVKARVNDTLPPAPAAVATTGVAGITQGLFGSQPIL